MALKEKEKKEERTEKMVVQVLMEKVVQGAAEVLVQEKAVQDQEVVLMEKVVLG